MSVKKKSVSRNKKIAENLKEKGAVRPATANKPAKSLHRASDSRLRASGMCRATSATSTAQSEERKDQNAEFRVPGATIESQIAFLESQIAKLQGIGDREKGIGKRAEDKSLSPNPYPLSPSLPAPVLAVPTTAGDSVFVRWSEVPGADSIEISLAYDADFTKPAGMMGVDGSRTWATLPEMTPDTTWFIRLKAYGVNASAESAWSNVRSIRTLPEGMAGTSDETATNLQTWLDALRGVDEQFFSSLPQFGNVTLTPSERRRALGSGVRRYGFIDKVSDVAEEFPQFWPAYFNDQEKLKEWIRDIEVLRNLLLFFESGSRVVLDMLLTAGNDAFQLANMYYRSVRNAAREQNPEGEAVFRMLQLFWHRRRRTVDEPTERELMRDARALLRGSKEGTVSVSNESDQVVRGERVLIDNTQRKPRGGVKIVERGTALIDRSTGVE